MSENVASAAEVLRRRLDAIEADADMHVAHGSISIELGGSSEQRREVQTILSENARLEFRAVDDTIELDSYAASLPAGVTADAEHVPVGREDLDHRTTFFVATGAGARERLAAHASTIDLGDRELLVGKRTVWEVPDGTDPGYRTYVVERTAPVDGTMVADAWTVSDPHTMQPVLLQFDDRGRQAFADLSTALVGRRLAIIVDGEVVSAPIVNEPITGGRSQITLGDLDPATASTGADELAMLLKAGALPAPIRLERIESIEPTYGTGALWGVLAILAAVALAALAFGIVRYRLAGLALATPLLVAPAAIALGALLDATVTLPGSGAFAAGLLVSLGASFPLAEAARSARRGKPAKRWLAAGVPAVALVALAIVGVALYAAVPGPARGFAGSLLVTTFAGLSVAPLWSFAVAAVLWPRAPQTASRQALV